MNRGRFLYGLDLNDDSRIDQEVDAQSIHEPEAIVLERYDFLPLDLKAPSLQIAAEDRLINRFEKPRTERSMQFERSIDDLARHFVQ